MIDAPSSNFDDRPAPPSMIVMHYTGMESGEEALARLRDPSPPAPWPRVSAHYVVETDGAVFALVPEEKRAWHAGVGKWRGQDDVNGASIGIEIVNPGHFWGYTDFPAPQMDSVLALTKAIVARHGIDPRNVVGHSDIAPGRKDDPGERFPWHRFAAEDLALPVYSGEAVAERPDYEAAIKSLQDIGYDVDWRAPIAATLAFQRRFCPSLLGQGLSPETRDAIAWVRGRV